jgi:uncharacterized membrane protein
MTLRLRNVLVGLSLLGVGIAGYLSWVKLTDTEAFCGGVGDCSTVQNSIYAYLLGIPVAYLGLLCYLALLALALYNRRRQPERGSLPDLAFFALAAGGVAFSAYLTYTELFLLREVCPWCVASFVNLIVIVVLAAMLVFGQEAAMEEA